MHRSVEEEVDQFIADISLYSGKNAAILLEDREDMAFWERIVREFAPQVKPVFPFSSKSGKDALRKYVSHASKMVLICVDSDNDAYRQSQNSKWLHPRRPFVYQTYTHSRENHFIHPGNLQQDCKDLLQTEYDFHQDFSEISTAFHEWLVFWLFFTDENRAWLSECITNFNQEVSWGKLNEIVQSCFEESGFYQLKTLEEVRNISVFFREKILTHKGQVELLISDNGFDYLLDELEAFKQSCPIESHDALWFIQGHCAFEDVILPYFSKVIQLIFTDLAEKASTMEEHNHWQKRSKTNSYRDILSISYRNCFSTSQQCRFFDQIRGDIENDFRKT